MMSIIKRTVVVVMMAVSLAWGMEYAMAQGSLTPPGVPATMMKTLDQVEARIPLVDGSPGVSIGVYGTITISQPGSYYLTENLTVPTGNGITINASDVSLDLNGFTIRSTNAATGYKGIEINGSQVSVFNGHIKSGITYADDEYSGSGFNDGIYAIGSSCVNIFIRDITVSGVNSFGILIVKSNSVVESSLVIVAKNGGIQAEKVIGCRATTCGANAIEGEIVDTCIGKSTGFHGISATLVVNSYGYTIGASSIHTGIVADLIQNSYGYSRNGKGIFATGTVVNSYGKTGVIASSPPGIKAEVAVGCTAVNGEDIHDKYDMP